MGQVPPTVDELHARIEQLDRDNARLREENARLIDELQDSKRELTGSLDQQAAIAEVLEAVGAARDDPQPVFEAIAAAAGRLIGHEEALFSLRKGDTLHHVATFGADTSAVMRGMTRRIDERSVAGAVALHGKVIQVEDFGKVGPEVYPDSAESARQLGQPALIGVPMVRDRDVLGVILVSRKEARAFDTREVALLQQFATQAAVAIANAGLIRQLRERNAEVSEALDRETAMAEVLEIISRSPAEVGPVFDAVVEKAGRLCGAEHCVLYRVEGDSSEVIASFVASEDPSRYPPVGTVRPLTGRVLTRTVETAATFHLATTVEELNAEFPLASQNVDVTGHTHITALNIPLMRGDAVVGVLQMHRMDGVPFPPPEVALLETFADQAVIAIENARLFNELQESNREVTEALDQQTAMAEVLEIISRSATDATPVLHEIARHAARLLNVDAANCLQIDGDVLRYTAHYSVPALNNTDHLFDGLTIALDDPANGHMQAIRSRRRFAYTLRSSSDIPEGTAEPSRRVLDALMEFAGAFSALIVPMLKDDQPIGCIEIGALGERRFSDREARLLHTFADQAVIAIENARLFNELQESNREVREALDHQTAISQVLEIISSSPSDLQSVLNSIVEHAAGLAETEAASVSLLDGDDGQVVASWSGGSLRRHASLETPDVFTGARGIGWTSGAAIAARRTVSVSGGSEAILAQYPAESSTMARLAAHGDQPYGSAVLVPLLRGEEAVGILIAWRTSPEAYSDRQISLLEAFADQAVIAIENARLFNELQESNREVTEALEQQTATSKVLEAISRAPTDLQDVLDTLLSSAVRLVNGKSGALLQLSGDTFTLQAVHAYREHEAMVRAGVPRTPLGTQFPRDFGILGAALQTVEGINWAGTVDDLAGRWPDSAAVTGPQWKAMGYDGASQAVVPLLRGADAIGALAVVREGLIEPLTQSQMALLRTFADQAVIAIENARLFNELQESNREVREALDRQTAMGEVLEIIGRSPAEVRPVFEAVVERAARLCDAEQCVVYTIEGENSVVEAAHVRGLEPQRYLPVGTVRAIEGRVLERAVRTRQPFHAEMAIAELDVEFPRMRENLNTSGHERMTALNIPLIRGGGVVGVLQMHRFDSVAFSTAELALVESFADQAVIAIENARLFNEIQQKTLELEETNARLEVASRHKSEFLANMSHELRTPLNAIIGYAELLEEECQDLDDEAYVPDLHKIHSAGQHLLTLISGILDLSKIEAGRMTMYLEDFDVLELVSEVQAIVAPLVEGNRNAFRVECSDDLGTMRADLVKVRQVLFNLLSNAAKFTEDGTVTLLVAREPERVTFAVRDTGIGMTPEQVSRLFEAFSQVHVEDGKRYQGTGLGLNLSREFCLMMGGDVSVESQPGAGSTFTVVLPVTVAELGADDGNAEERNEDPDR